MVVCSTCGETNPDRARFCLNCGASLTTPEAASRETRKTVTVVFADITGSTAMGERLDPEATRALLARYFAAMREVLERHGGTVEKFIGDAVMAVFGVPTLHEDDALRAVRAASDMRERLAELNAASSGTALQMRIGVNTGEVVAGTGGNQLLVTGDAVNVAARLEQAAAPGEILIGSSTEQLVREAVSAEPVEPLVLKGKADPVPAFRLLGVTPGQRTRLDRFDAPLVGRQRELHMLREALERATAERSVHLFTLLGQPGVGKSRLVHEFLAAARDQAGVLRGRCLPYGEGITYWPIGEIVRTACGIVDADARDLARAKLLSRLGHLPRADEVGGYVAAAIGLSDATPPREQIFWAIRRFCEQLAAERPLVLVLDDLQWAEPTLVELVEHLVEWGHAPMLLLVMARPELLERPGGWASATPNATALRLEPLTAVEAGQLIGNLAGTEALPAALLERVTSAAEGNPLFVEEFMAMLRDTGHLGKADGHRAGDSDLSALAVPPNIAALLGARLDALEPLARNAVGRAAVIGETFAVAELGALTPDSERDALPGLLHALTRRGLLRPDSDILDEDAYRFGHLLARDAAYAALPKQRRAELHERFAAWLEASAGERLPELETIVAHHLESAYRYRVEVSSGDEAARDLAERAITHLTAAALRARDRGDAPAAAELFTRAVELARPGDRRRAEFLLDAGLGELTVGRFTKAEQAWIRMHQEAEETGDPALVAVAEMLTLNFGGRRNPRRIAADLEAAVERIRGAFPEGTNPLVDAVCWDTLGEVSQNLCRFRELEQRARHAVAAATRAGHATLVRQARFRLVDGLAFGPRPPGEVADEMVTLQQDVRPDAAAMLALPLAQLGQFDEARRVLSKARTFAEELGMRDAVAVIDATAGRVAELRGNLPEAVEGYRSGADILAALGETDVYSSFEATLAVLLARLHRLDEAAEVANRARAASAPDDIASQAEWRRAVALVHAGRGRPAVAERLAREAVEISRSTDALDLRGDAYRTLAEVLESAGRHKKAVAELHEALRLYEAKGVLPKVEEIRRHLASESSNGL